MTTKPKNSDQIAAHEAANDAGRKASQAVEAAQRAANPAAYRLLDEATDDACYERAE